MERDLQLKIGNRKYKRNFVYYSINKEININLKKEKSYENYKQNINGRLPNRSKIR